jgi:squalene-hopene/tetraprenyl-beta-curcumene cyclase
MTSVANELESSAGPSRVEPAIERAAHALLKSQQSDGHWVFELEADATIPAEYVLLRHYRGEPRNMT